MSYETLGKRGMRQLRFLIALYYRILARPVLKSRSRRTWIAFAGPDPGLTWGLDLDGRGFIEETKEYFGPEKSLLEIGPGYGRLLDSVLASGLSFKDYLGMDLSRRNVDFLRQKYADPRISFVLNDAESAKLDFEYDLLISSLTFKHLYPTFETALVNLSTYAKPGAILTFDLVESGKGRTFLSKRIGGQRWLRGDAFFQKDGVYIRRYRRDEIGEIVQRANLELVKFGSVVHAERYPRLLVTARRRSRN